MRHANDLTLVVVAEANLGGKPRALAAIDHLTNQNGLIAVSGLLGMLWSATPQQLSRILDSHFSPARPWRLRRLRILTELIVAAVKGLPEMRRAVKAPGCLIAWL